MKPLPVNGKSLETQLADPRLGERIKSNAFQQAVSSLKPENVSLDAFTFPLSFGQAA
jgi:hypothetical protein